MERCPSGLLLSRGHAFRSVIVECDEAVQRSVDLRSPRRERLHDLHGAELTSSDRRDELLDAEGPKLRSSTGLRGKTAAQLIDVVINEQRGDEGVEPLERRADLGGHLVRPLALEGDAT